MRPPALVLAAALAVLPALTLAVGLAHADPPLPAAPRAELAKRGTLGKIFYIAPNETGPARWLVLVGDPSAPALSAWLVTPSATGAAKSIGEVSGWPRAVSVVDAVVAKVPGAIAGSARPHLLLVAESLPVGAIEQPAGLRTILPLALDAPAFVSTIETSRTSLTAFAGVANVADVTRRLQAAGAAWRETTSTPPTDEQMLALIRAAQKSDAALAKLVPTTGIALFETWQDTFARPTGTLAKLDRSPASQPLRDALAAATACLGTECGALVLGAEKDHVVIRAVLVPHVRARGTAPRHAVTASAADTQTLATARGLGVAGTLRSAAPLGGSGPATIGVVDDTVVVRDGAYALATPTSAEGGDVRFGDFDGDGLTDVLIYKDRPMFLLSPDASSGTSTAYLELSTIGTTGADAAATAALAVPDVAITTKQACAVVAKAKTARGLASVLAPGGEVFGYQEPGQPAASTRDTFTPKRAADALKGTCDITTCDARRALCASRSDGPSQSFYQFAKVGTAWKLLRAAIYAGS